MKKVAILLMFLTPLLHTQSENLQGISIFTPRSQSVNAVRYITGSHPYEHRYNVDCSYFTFKATPEFKMSYKSNRIAQALWGTDTLFVSGSEIESREQTAILADYFGLSPEFQSEVCLKPEIKNFTFTLSGYIGFDSWIRGLYLAIHAPFAWTKWDFKLEETILNSGANVPFPEFYMDAEEVTPPYSSFTNALVGNKTYGQMSSPLQFGKLCGSRSKGGLADLLLILGYDIVSTENGYAGLNFRVKAPTGSRPDGKFYFEPIIGNGKHWEVGAGFAGRILVWEADGEQEISLFGELNLSHLFKARQTRSFDFCENGFGSRFILLKEFDPVEQSYTGTLTPAINVTTLCCDVSVAIEMEFLAMFGYHHKEKGVEFDLGYNGWLRSHEKISLRECIPDNSYGLKGIQDAATMLGGNSDFTQSTATLRGNQLSDQMEVVDTNSPIFISTDDLDLSSAASELVLTHKLFFYLGYGWQETEDNWFVPFLGLGSSIEFEGINDPSEKKPSRNTLSQWGFWIHGGCAFS